MFSVANLNISTDLSNIARIATWKGYFMNSLASLDLLYWWSALCSSMFTVIIAIHGALPRRRTRADSLEHFPLY